MIITFWMNLKAKDWHVLIFSVIVYECWHIHILEGGDGVLLIQTFKSNSVSPSMQFSIRKQGGVILCRPSSTLRSHLESTIQKYLATTIISKCEISYYYIILEMLFLWVKYEISYYFIIVEMCVCLSLCPLGVSMDIIFIRNNIFW